jgi:hypothetical protein
MGYLAHRGDGSKRTLAQAMVMGTVMASFTVEDFSLNRLAAVDRSAILERVEQVKRLTAFGRIRLE